MTSLLIFASLVTFTGGATSTNQIFNWENTNNLYGTFTIEFLPTNNIPTPLSDMFLYSGSGGTLENRVADLSNPQNLWQSPTSETSAFLRDTPYKFELSITPYVAYKSDLRFYYTITNSVVYNHSFYLNAYFTTGDNIIGNYQQGYDEGFDFGYQKGQNEIIQSGFDRGGFSGLGILSNVFNAMGSILNIEVFPNVSIGALVSIPLIGGALFLILKMLRG